MFLLQSTLNKIKMKESRHDFAENIFLRDTRMNGQMSHHAKVSHIES